MLFDTEMSCFQNHALTKLPFTPPMLECGLELGIFLKKKKKAGQYQRCKTLSETSVNKAHNLANKT